MTFDCECFLVKFSTTKFDDGKMEALAQSKFECECEAQVITTWLWVLRANA